MKFKIRQLRQITKGKHPETVIDLKSSGEVEYIEHIPQTGGRSRLDWSAIWDCYANKNMKYPEIAKSLGYSRQSVRNVIMRIKEQRDAAILQK